jgi:hypothetical protein
MDEHEEVWVESPADILKRLVLLPSRGYSFGAKVNALTRLLIVVVVVLAVLKWRYWPAVLTIGIFLILFLYLLKAGNVEIEHFDDDMSGLKHHTTPLCDLYVQGQCEIEVLKDERHESPQADSQDISQMQTQPTLTRKNHVPRMVAKKVPVVKAPVNIRRPKTTKITVDPKKSDSGGTAYNEYQASWDYERKHAPPTPDYSGVVGYL